MCVWRLPAPIPYCVLDLDNMIYDTPAVDMLDYGDNTGCFALFNEAELDQEYSKCEYVYVSDDTLASLLKGCTTL